MVRSRTPAQLMYANVRIKRTVRRHDRTTITSARPGRAEIEGHPVHADYACNDEQDLVECSASRSTCNTRGRYTFKVTQGRAGKTIVSRAYTSSPTRRRRAGGATSGDARVDARPARVVRRVSSRASPRSTQPPPRRRSLSHRRRRRAHDRPEPDRARPAGQRHVRTPATAARVRRLNRCRRRSTRPGPRADLQRIVPAPVHPGRSRAGDALRTGTYAKTLTFTLWKTTR